MKTRQIEAYAVPLVDFIVDAERADVLKQQSIDMLTIKGMTGIDDPYESPTQAEVYIDTTELTPDEAAQDVFLFLEREGYIK